MRIVVLLLSCGLVGCPSVGATPNGHGTPTVAVSKGGVSSDADVPHSAGPTSNAQMLTCDQVAGDPQSLRLPEVVEGVPIQALIGDEPVCEVAETWTVRAGAAPQDMATREISIQLKGPALEAREALRARATTLLKKMGWEGAYLTREEKEWHPYAVKATDGTRTITVYEMHVGIVTSAPFPGGERWATAFGEAAVPVAKLHASIGQPAQRLWLSCEVSGAIGGDYWSTVSKESTFDPGFADLGFQKVTDSVWRGAFSKFVVEFSPVSKLRGAHITVERRKGNPLECPSLENFDDDTG